MPFPDCLISRSRSRGDFRIHAVYSPRWHAGAIKHDVRPITSAELLALGNDILFLGVQDMVGTKLFREPLSGSCNLGHDDVLDFLRDQALHDCQANGSTAEDEDSAVRCKGRGGDGMPCDRQRFDEC